MSTQKLLDRLTRLKQIAPAKWLACCPAHADRSPSLSIRELEDGRTLINCFAGCGAADVVQAVGLTLSDLYEKPLGQHFAPSRSSIPARDLLEILAHEATVAALITNDLVERRAVNPEQVQRLFTAAGRIGKARDHARG